MGGQLDHFAREYGCLLRLSANLGFCTDLDLLGNITICGRVVGRFRQGRAPRVGLSLQILPLVVAYCLG